MLRCGGATSQYVEQDRCDSALSCAQVVRECSGAATHMAGHQATGGMKAALLLVLGCCACFLGEAAVQDYQYGPLAGPAKWGGTCAAGKAQVALAPPSAS